MVDVVESGKAHLACTDRRPDGSPVGTVVALHAGVADRRVYDDAAPVWVRNGWRVVTYDRRGFGDTPAEDDDGRDAMADLLAVLDGHDIERAVLVGNSMGGSLAVDTAIAHPSRVAGLVVVASMVGGQPWDPDRVTTDERALAEAMQAAEAEGDVDGVNRLEAHYWLDGPGSEEGRVGGPARELFLDMNGRALRAGQAGDIDRRADTWERVAGIEVPALVVTGLLDEADTVAACRELVDRLPDARLVELPGSAHLPMLDDPERFSSIVAEFLDRFRVS